MRTSSSPEPERNPEAARVPFIPQETLVPVLPFCTSHASLEAALRRIDDVEACVQRIDDKMDRIIKRLGSGDVSIATLDLRVKFLEKLVYGAVGLALASLVTAVLTVVVKG